MILNRFLGGRVNKSLSCIVDYRELESLYEEGLCKSIGVSNFMINHLEALLPHCKIKPHVNQVRESIALSDLLQ